MAIDRRTHDADVMERVLGIDEQRPDEDVRTEVIELGLQPLMAGMLISAVQLTVGGLRPRRPASQSRR